MNKKHLIFVYSKKEKNNNNKIPVQTPVEYSDNPSKSSKSKS